MTALRPPAPLRARGAGAPALAAFATLAALALAVVALSLMLGTYGLSLSGLGATLAGNPPDDTARTVVLELRLPRSLAALACGALLGLSGAILQGLTRNGLADPSLLGVSQGAALAVVGLIVLAPGAPQGLRAPLAVLGSLAAAGLVQALAAGPRGAGPLRLVLTGLGLSAFLSALISTLLTHGGLREAQAALGWLAGSVNAAGWAEVRLLALAALLAAPATVVLARPLGALRFGPEVAQGLGLPLARARGGALVLAVAAAAVATAAAGPLAFVGLVAPHAATRLARTGPGAHLALSAAAGAVLVAAADLAGRTLVAPAQIPAGLVTALIGGPAFALLLLRGGASSPP